MNTCQHRSVSRSGTRLGKAHSLYYFLISHRFIGLPRFACSYAGWCISRFFRPLSYQACLMRGSCRSPQHSHASHGIARYQASPRPCAYDAFASRHGEYTAYAFLSRFGQFYLQFGNVSSPRQYRTPQKRVVLFTVFMRSWIVHTCSFRFGARRHYFPGPEHIKYRHINTFRDFRLYRFRYYYIFIDDWLRDSRQYHSAWII